MGLFNTRALSGRKVSGFLVSTTAASKNNAYMFGGNLLTYNPALTLYASPNSDQYAAQIRWQGSYPYASGYYANKLWDNVSQLSFETMTYNLILAGLYTAIEGRSGLSNDGTAGYVMGTTNTAGDNNKRIQKFDYLTKIASQVGLATYQGSNTAMGWGNKNVAGYRVAGGPQYPWDTSIEKFNFTTELSVGVVGYLTAGGGPYSGGESSLAAYNWGVAGYGKTGYTGPGTNQQTNYITKMSFTTDATSNNSSGHWDWQSAAGTLNNQAVAAYTSGGYNYQYAQSDSPYVSKMNFATEVYSLLATPVQYAGSYGNALTNTGVNGVFTKNGSAYVAYGASKTNHTASLFNFATETGSVFTATPTSGDVSSSSSLNNSGN